MLKEENGIFGEEQSTVTVRDRLAAYLAWWPLFLICITMSVGAGILYTRYAVPKYIATTSFLIKSSEGSKANSQDLIESALSGKKEVNLNNEILLISSSSLMERTVAKSNFNISYIKKGRLLDIDIYKDAPFRLIAKELTKKSSTYTIEIKNIYMVGGTFMYGPPKGEKLFTFRWNEPFTIDGQSFVLTPKRTIAGETGNYSVRWQPISEAAAELSQNLTIKPYDAKTSVILLSIKTENLQKGKDVLDALFMEFNLSDKEERVKLSESTVQFIDDRLLAISGELKGIEGNLENYQGSNQLIDIKGQSTQSLDNLNIVSRTIKDLAIQQGVVGMISEYFSNPANSNKLVPSSLGINDGTLSLLITQYNELQLKKEREAPLVAPNSTVMQDINTQIGSLKGSILESLNNITKNLRLQENSFQQQNSQYQNYLSTIPGNERVLQEIRRKQSITEGLYLYLMQKREESAISGTASNVANYKQIDPATGYGPVEPNTRNIIIYTAFLGFFVAFASIYLKELLNDKITSKEDITNRTATPIVGQIGHIPRKEKQVVSVLERNAIGEQFRAIRTNLSFLLKDKSKKVILVTSSASNEGKTFVSLNLAAVFAIPGKKVALLEFDTRQPVIATNLHFGNTLGLTDYLTGKVNSISEISFVLDEISTLHIYPCGPVPVNPADLLLSQNMNRLFEALRSEYDYIIIDTPPAGLVSDALIIGKFSDIVLYILRYKKTLKKQIHFVNEIINQKTLINVTLMLNDVSKSSRNDYTYGGGYHYDGVNGATRKKDTLKSSFK